SDALVLRKQDVTLRRRAIVGLVVDGSREADLREDEGWQLSAKRFQRSNEFGAGFTTRIGLKPGGGQGAEEPPRAGRPLGFPDPRRVLSPRVRVVASPGEREAKRQHDSASEFQGERGAVGGQLGLRDQVLERTIGGLVAVLLATVGDDLLEREVGFVPAFPF